MTAAVISWLLRRRIDGGEGRHPLCHEFYPTPGPGFTTYFCAHCSFSVRWPERR